MAGMAARKVADLTIDEFKSLIHETIAEDIEAWKETFEIMADKRLMSKIRKADADWQAGKKDAYISWGMLCPIGTFGSGLQTCSFKRRL